MQVPTNKSITRQRIEQDRVRYRMNWFLKGILLLVVLAGVGVAGIYFGWDYLPDSIQYRVRQVEAFFPKAPPPEAVPTPAFVEDPSQTLANLVIASATPTVAPTATTAVTPTVALSATVAAAVESTVAPTTEPPTATPAPTQTPLPLYQPAASAYQITNVRHEYQGWNNCGPTTLAMNLSAYGRPETQKETAPFLKPNRDDKNVSPNELVSYANFIGYGSHYVIGLDVPTLKLLVSNNIPVIVETWYIPEPNDEMGHYLLMTGYDGDTLIFQDSYHGPNVRENAAEFDHLWKVFNRTAIIVYPPEQEALVTSILGDMTDPAVQAQRAITLSYSDVQADPNDKFAWFNLGTAFTMAGDTTNAVQAFDTARSLKLPWRMMWYQFAPYEAYFAQGRYDEIVSLASSTLESAGSNLEESFYWRGRAYEALGNADAARSDFETAQRLNPNYTPAQDALAQLN